MPSERLASALPSGGRPLVLGYLHVNGPAGRAAQNATKQSYCVGTAAKNKPPLIDEIDYTARELEDVIRRLSEGQLRSNEGGGELVLEFRMPLEKFSSSRFEGFSL